MSEDLRQEHAETGRQLVVDSESLEAAPAIAGADESEHP
jgi:hypothetical protein